MENKILKYFFLLCLFFSSYVLSQTKKINFLIMVDEKPCLMVNDMHLNSPSMGSIDINYTVGTIDLSDDNYYKFTNDKSLNFTVSFETFLPKSALIQKYLFSVPKEFLNQKYIIINIFNKDNEIYKKRYSKADKHNKEYYVVISSPNSMKFD
jgi:hypothetical protein